MANLLSIVLLFVSENITTIFISIIVFVLSYSLIHRHQMRSKLPPGPMGLPFVGSLFTLIVSLISIEHPHDMVTRLSVRYGKVFSLGFGGGSRVIYLNDYASVKEAFVNSSLTARPPGNMVKTLTGTSGVVMASGTEWHHQRKFSLSVFRKFGVGKNSFEAQIAVEAKHLGDEFNVLDGKPCDPMHLLMNATSNVICSIIFGRRFDYKNEEFKKMLTLLDTRMILVGAGSLFTSVPILKFVFIKKTQKIASVVSQLLDYFRSIVDDHKSHLETACECENLIDLYLKDLEENQREISGNENVTGFGDERQLVALIDNLFMAGSETSSSTLGWCLLYMVAYPKVQEQMQDEIQTVCGDRLPTFADQQHMPYTHSVILEIQRLHTIATLGVPHFATKDTTLQGYEIPKGSLVVSNLWGVLHDPDVWPNPNQFKPERFLNSNNEVEIPAEWIPFSIGRRVCLGEKLGKAEIFIMLTHLLSRFNFRSADGGQPLVYEGRRDAATFCPLPFQVCAITR